MNNQFSNAIEKIVPTAFLMMPSGTYQNQHVRSWDISGGVQQLNALTRHIAATAAVSVSSDTINSAAQGMLTVNTAHQGLINITDGWGTKRGVFILRFNVHYAVGTVYEWIVQGYTDHPAFTSSSIDENMVFYINNVFCMSRSTVRYNGIDAQRMKMVSDYQVVNGFSSANGPIGGNVLIRPRDMMANISTAALMGEIKVTDVTQLANMNVQTSNHANNVASQMLSSSLNTWHQASSELDVTCDVGTVAEMAYSRLMEKEADQDLFMAMLAKHNNTGAVSSSFTGNQLKRTMEGIMSIYQVISSNGSSGVQWSNSGQSSEHSGNYESMIAIQVQAMLPSIMVESLLSGVAFSVTNNSGSLEFARSYVSAFMPEMDAQCWETFRGRIEREIIPFFTRLGVSFFMTVQCSFYQEIKIQIKINDTVEFISPAFCNALYSPVQTTSVAHARDFAQSFETIALEVNEALMESAIRRADSSNRIIDSSAPIRQNNAFSMPRQVQQPTASPSLNISPAKTGGMFTSVSGPMTGNVSNGNPAMSNASIISNGPMTAGFKH